MGLTNLFPKEYRKSAYTIDYEKWYQSGKRAVLFDIDNTLVRDAYPADENAVRLMQRLKEIGFSPMLLSNNTEKRAAPFAKAVDVPLLCHAHKPSAKGYLKCCELLEVTREQVLFVGDQIFTDIWGANRAGIFSILTKKIHRKELFMIKLKRIPEIFIKLFYRIYCAAKGREYLLP